MGPDVMIFKKKKIFSFRLAFSLSSFTFIKSLFIPLHFLPLACYHLHIIDFLGGSDGKSSAYNAGDGVQSLGWEDLLEKEVATHMHILRLLILLLTILIPACDSSSLTFCMMYSA